MASDTNTQAAAPAAAATTTNEHLEYDLLIITDATASMTTFLSSLHTSLQSIIRISTLTDAFSRIGVLAYRDHDCVEWSPQTRTYDNELARVTEFSGWFGQDQDKKELLRWAQGLKTQGGYSTPEAGKTGAHSACEIMGRDSKEGVTRKTVVIWYADESPHLKLLDNKAWEKEQEALGRLEDGEEFKDWVSACHRLRDNGAQVFCVTARTFKLKCRKDQSRDGLGVAAVYSFLSQVTSGKCFSFDSSSPRVEDISQLTVGILLGWMGAVTEKKGHGSDRKLAYLNTYRTLKGIEAVESETGIKGSKWLPVSADKDVTEHLRCNLINDWVSEGDITEIITVRDGGAVQDFATRYMMDEEYKKLVCAQLEQIIETDVTVMALNPVFGTLWRSVCSDRANPARDELITKFGLHVDKIPDAESKARMKSWLEASYDMKGEIVAIIKELGDAQKYPCVFLDPTIRFAGKNENEGDSQDMVFTRDELLEIGRSCDYKILRRLGKVLTRLTFVASKEDLPAHVKGLDEAELPRIPLALAQPEHKRTFWRILLHTVLPGTMLALRPAALVAALTLRMGIKALEDAAFTELSLMKESWNTLDIPETWNTNCLNLLLDANKKRSDAVLNKEDTKLFEGLVSYKLLEMNLGTNIPVKVGWTPEKTRAHMGPVAICKSCNLPRSVTIIGKEGICGLCHNVKEDTNKERAYKMVHENVSKGDNALTEISWVECSMNDCRAQYVVYFPNQLNVRPKCWFCRQKGRIPQSDPEFEQLTTAPCVSCSICANRVIWPVEHRPEGFEEAAFICAPCVGGTKSRIEEEELSIRALVNENGREWLLKNDEDMIPSNVVFGGRSVFFIVSNLTHGREHFAEKVQVLPASDSLSLKVRGKKVHNVDDAVKAVKEWVGSRRVQSGTCSLCFSDHRKKDLRLACGRRGCGELICSECADSWYGINQVGKIINIAALSCPFCRRQPSTKVKLPEGVRYLEGLKGAVEEAGSWIFAWCTSCSSAKRHMERVCAAGAPMNVENWKCEDCALTSATLDGLAFKPCPGCGVATQKTAGCDHMTCTVSGCFTHWCFKCGEKVDQKEIYHHMSMKHGGWYNGREYEELDDEDDDEGDFDFVDEVRERVAAVALG
ncbi:hypothetical protein QBC40DRAFT_278605 [Triangularia verruculosa]|uniref:RBR-type E3 ubiquitin transferase n=1 Tax=Triangularia verruculosa TaxID=2587418 RepID=A0AAN6XI16_9PEZI|nr:hypothetical protein QBC40DRAFT_278605 [Triangularia verruculosa]